MTSSTIAADLAHSDTIQPVPASDSELRQRPPFGLSRRVWAFIKVFVAASLSCLALYWTARHAIDWQPTAWGVADRLALAAKAVALAMFPALVAVAVVASQRLNPEYFSGGQVKRDSVLETNARFIQNTYEQFLLFLVGSTAMALYLLPVDAEAIPVFAAIFLTGRVLFWWGYHYNTYVRSFGFGLTFYPTVAIYAWLALHMTTGIYISI